MMRSLFGTLAFRVTVAKSGFMGVGHIGTITYSQHRSPITSFVRHDYSYMTSTAAAGTLHALQCLGASSEGRIQAALLRMQNALSLR